MICRNKKITLFVHFPYECTAVEEYLEQMAQKGWLLEAIKGNLFTFKKIEPKRLKYSVDVLDKVSIFDRKDSDVALEYREYCEAAGWHYVCQNGKIQVFYTEGDKKTISIHTDEEEKFKSVFKASLFNIFGQIILVGMFILNIYLQLFCNMEITLTSNLGILSLIVMFSCVIFASITIISFLFWVIKSKVYLKQNKFMPYNSYKQLKLKNIFNNIYLLVGLILFLLGGMIEANLGIQFIIGVFAITFIPLIIYMCTKKFINKKRYSKKVNMAITIGSMVVSMYLAFIFLGMMIFSTVINKIDHNVTSEEVGNLTLVDFGFKESSIHYSKLDNSILAKRADYSYGNGDDFLGYSVFQSEYPWIIKFGENRLIRWLNKCDIDIKQEKTNLPSNIKVYSDSKKRSFVLVSENKVVDITKGFEDIDEEEFLNTVYKKIFQ